MKTRVLDADQRSDIETAAEFLRGGGLVAFPTETVYGLGARADLPQAVTRLREVKVRPPGKQMAVLVSGITAAERLVGPLPEAARRIAESFWPGPVTLVVAAPKGEGIGLRCPAVHATLELIEALGHPVFAPSANPAGEPPALSAGEVLAYFEGRIEAVLDGGRVEIGEPSTVVRVAEKGLELLRAGAAPFEAVRHAAGKA
jgi:L-threonylcarbamoyladenylate synthase